MSHIAKYCWLTIGWISFALGAIGAAVPLLPTTPFMILAAYCFSKGSRRLHAWLLSLPAIGPMIRDWEEHGVIRKSAKITASTALVVLMIPPLLLLAVPNIARFLMVSVATVVLSFIWTRPSEIEAEGARKPSSDPKSALTLGA